MVRMRDWDTESGPVFLVLALPLHLALGRDLIPKICQVEGAVREGETSEIQWEGLFPRVPPPPWSKDL